MLVACTVIAPDDLAERLLDREQHPAFQGERTQLVNRWPDDPAERWDTYLSMRARSLAAGGNGEEATAFYAEHRAEMDAGAEVGWEARFDAATELSALQHAYNLKQRFGAQFGPEFQNQPVERNDASLAALSPEQLRGRIVRTPRGTVPADVERLTAFIDVQQDILWWMVCGWKTGLGGHVVDYGGWPDQRRSYFTKRDAKKHYAHLLPGASQTAQIRNALDGCIDHLLGRAWPRAGGGDLRIEMLGIDEGWAPSQDVIYQLCAESKHGGLLIPCKGVGVHARQEPFPDRKAKPGQRIGHHWMLTRAPNRALPHLVVDANRWKGQIREGLLAPLGDPSAITFYDDEHGMLNDHLTAERATPVTANGRTLDVFDEIPGRDNDLGDCLSGCAVTASLRGVSASAQAVAPPAPRRPRRRYEASI